MTDQLAHLVQDLRAHAHEAPEQCRALMRVAAAELERWQDMSPIGLINDRAKPRAEHPRGECRICGCTDDDACVVDLMGPCVWADDAHTLCDNPACLEAARR